MFKKFFLISALILTLLAGAQSQHKELVKKKVSDAPAQKADYEPNTVLFKVKEDYGALFKNAIANLHLLNGKMGKYLKIQSVAPTFPDIKPPEKEKNNLGQPLTDLSLIYTLVYEGGIGVEEVVKIMTETGIVEYAEPMYRTEILAIPNDPFIQPGQSQEFYFKNMKAFEAFEVEQGDTNVVIGIIDTGVKYDHEDLKDNIKYNYADPIDGIDNDGDGYIDNFMGWDLGNNDNNPWSPVANEHGTLVAGIAGAKTNNGTGVAGTGYKCKILPLKAGTDNPSSSINQGYPAITYAANHGCKVINLSWGGTGGFSATFQQVINYAAINKDVVVVAAAGNTHGDLAFFPASYDNVLSVASVNTEYNAALDSFIETKAGYATYNYNVDITAQGSSLTTTTNAGYMTDAIGSSFASPLVAGAAGLLRSRYPDLSALQIAELLRVTADPLIDTVAGNIEYKNEKLGKGRLNMYRSLTDTILPSVRMIEDRYFNRYGEFAVSGDTIQVKCKYRNYLRPTNNVTVTLSTANPNVVVIDGVHTLGSIATLGTADPASEPFIIYIKPEAGINEKITFRLGYSDPSKGYQDYQYFETIINPPFMNIDTNLIDMSVTSVGRFGYSDDQSSTGIGLTYKGQSLLYEGGLMIAANQKVSDCVRGTPPGEVDFDFDFLQVSKYVQSYEADQEIVTVLTDTISPVDPVGVVVRQRSYAHKNSPDDKYIVIEYDVTNVSGHTIDSLNVGIYADWDIQNASQNKANWNVQDSIGYTYFTGANGIYAGICLLTNNAPSCFSMDHGALGGNNINPNDGFTTSEKYFTLSNGVYRPQAGGAGAGYDVSQVVAGLLRDLAPDEKKTIAFAFVVGDDVLDLKANARRAKNWFRSVNTSPLPTVADLHYCEGDTVNATITPANGTSFNYYNSLTGSEPVHTGNSFTRPQIFKSDTVFVRGADSLFESGAVASRIIFHSDLQADFGFTPATVNLDINPYAFFIDKSDHAVSVFWDLGDGTTINNSSEILHEYTTPGTYRVQLLVTGDYGCTDTISKYIVVTGNILSVNNPHAADGLHIYPNPASAQLHLDFSLPSSADVEINIFNLLGEEVFNSKDKHIENKEYIINLQEFQKGIYYAKILIGSRSVTRTFVVQ